MPVTYIYDGTTFQPIAGIPGSKGDQGDIGPEGPSAVSVDAGNQSVLGSDSLIYTPDFGIGVYLPLAGGVMSGFLTLNASPLLPSHAATKQYVDELVFSYLPLSGGEMTGTIWWSPGANIDGFIAGIADVGRQRMTFSAGQEGGSNQSRIELYGPDDTSAPGDSNYYAATHAFHSFGANNRMQIHATDVTLAVPLIVPDGTDAAPGLKMTSSLAGLYALGDSMVMQSGVTTGYRVAATANNFQVTKNHDTQMQLNQFFTVLKAYSETTGDAANMNVNSGGAIRRSTSAAKYKSDITDASYLKDIVLAPSKFYRADDDRYLYGMVADPLAAQDSLLGAYGNTHELIQGEEFSHAETVKKPEIEWELENYDQGAYNAIVAAKLNDMNDRLLALEP